MKKTDILERLRWWRTRPFTADTYDKHDASLRAALEEACDEITLSRQRVADLEAALRPFAKLCQVPRPDGIVFVNVHISDLHAAAKLLEKAP